MDDALFMDENKQLGRPTKYKPEYCQLLIDHMSQGFSFRSFGAIPGVCEDTLHEWCKVYPDFSESKKIGQLKQAHALESIGIKAMEGKIPGFNATAWIFFMKNTQGWRSNDGGNSAIENQPINITITKDSNGN